MSKMPREERLKMLRGGMCRTHSQESQPAAEEPAEEAQLNAHGQSQQIAADGDSGWFPEDDMPTQRCCPDSPVTLTQRPPEDELVASKPATPPAPAIMSAPATLPPQSATERKKKALRQ